MMFLRRMRLSFSAIIMTTLITQSSQFSCQQDDTIYDYWTVLSCNNITNIADLPTTKTDDRIITLTFTNSKITKLQKAAFRNYPSMTFLELNNLNLKALSNHTFQGLRELEELSLSHNQLSTLPNHIFHGLRNLTKLYLDNNKLRQLSPDQFVDCRNLTQLDLSANKISRFFYGTFDNLRNLRIFNVSHNHLLTLDQFALHSLVNLEQLFFSENYIDEFDAEDLVNHFSRLREISMDFCEFDCMQLRCIYDLLGNRIKVVGGYTFDRENVHGVACVYSKWTSVFNLRSNCLRDKSKSDHVPVLVPVPVTIS